MSSQPEVTDFVGSMALLRRSVASSDPGDPSAETSEWLLRRHGCSDTFRFLLAERLEQESFRDCLERELVWQLGLTRGKGYLISSVPRLHYEARLTAPRAAAATEEPSDPATESPPGSRLWVIQFFLVELVGRSAVQVIDQDPENAWFSSPAVLAGGASGRQIDRLHRQLIEVSGVVNAWE